MINVSKSVFKNKSTIVKLSIRRLLTIMKTIGDKWYVLILVGRKIDNLSYWLQSLTFLSQEQRVFFILF